MEENKKHMSIPLKLDWFNYYKVKINYRRVDTLKSKALPNGTIVNMKIHGAVEDFSERDGEMLFVPNWFKELMYDYTQYSYYEKDLDILYEVSHEEYLSELPEFPDHYNWIDAK